jgi:hypothetical protein
VSIQDEMARAQNAAWDYYVEQGKAFAGSTWSEEVHQRFEPAMREIFDLGWDAGLRWATTREPSK